MENQIKLVQLPKITHQLQKAGKDVDKRIAELNLDNLVATIDTVQALKSTRAELNSEHASFKEQLKEALEPAITPITEVKELFKANISEKYSPADSLLKDKIAIVENKVKDEKKENIIAYFKELCASHEIDFLTFDSLELDIKLSVTEKKYKERVNEYVAKVVDDINLIQTQDFEVEIMVEYKKTLNVSSSIQVIKDRKESERLETERVKQQEYLRRSKALQNIELRADAETKTYVFNNDIYVVWDKVKDLDKKEFENVVIQFDTKIKGIKLDEENARIAAEKKPEPKQTEQPEKQKVLKTVTKPVKVKEPVSTPKEEVKEDLEKVTASFEVTATYPELMKLKAFLVDNNFTYKNID
jgi:hypothetical protein